MSGSLERELCVVGFAYFELYAEGLHSPPRAGTEVFVPPMSASAGGALNTASVAHALGIRTVVAHPAGDGLADVAVSKLTESCGLAALTWPARADAAISIVLSRDGERSFVSSADFDALARCPPLPTSRWIHVVGLSEMQHLRDRLETARAGGAAVSVCGGWTPELLGDLASRKLPYDCIILNRMEAEQAGGSVEGAFELLGGAGADVIVTLGADGVSARVNGQRIELPAEPPDALVDVTGAGDAFCGGYIASRLCGGAPEPALKLGVRAAAIQISRMGGMAVDPADYDHVRLR